VAYLPLALFVSAQVGQVDAPSLQIAVALGGVSVALAALSLVLPARLFRNTVRQKKLALVEEVDPSAMPGAYREGAPKRRVFKEPAKAESVAVAVGMTAMIMQAAMGEAIALFGFTVLFLGNALGVGVPFFMVGWLAMALAWPSRAAWRRQLERAYEAHFPAPTEARAG
jgi:hypothetical protein